jgi:hypothetical protein
MTDTIGAVLEVDTHKRAAFAALVVGSPVILLHQGADFSAGHGPDWIAASLTYAIVHVFAAIGSVREKRRAAIVGSAKNIALADTVIMNIDSAAEKIQGIPRSQPELPHDRF